MSYKTEADANSVEFGWTKDPTPGVCIIRYEHTGKLLSKEWFTLEKAQRLAAQLNNVIQAAKG